MTHTVLDTTMIHTSKSHGNKLDLFCLWRNSEIWKATILIIQIKSTSKILDVQKGLLKSEDTIVPKQNILVYQIFMFLIYWLYGNFATLNKINIWSAVMPQ